jgi:hypothetical protein
MTDSRLFEKYQQLTSEFKKTATKPDRRYIIQQILKGIERDMERLGISKTEEKEQTSNKIT